MLKKSFQVGDRVVVNGNKMGSLRFCGTTDFAPGVWAGVEYDDEDGKNDGSVKGVVYFRCEKNHGVFVLASKVAKVRNNRERIALLGPPFVGCIIFCQMAVRTTILVHCYLDACTVIGLLHTHTEGGAHNNEFLEI